MLVRLGETSYTAELFQSLSELVPLGCELHKCLCFFFLNTLVEATKARGGWSWVLPFPYMEG